MTLSETFDLLDIAPPSDTAAPDGDTFEPIRAAITDALASSEIPGDDERAEPSLASLPFFIEFDEPVRLDPERVGLTWEVVAQQPPRMRLRSPFVALLLHLAPLLLIVGWAATVTDDPPLVPVHLVVEQAPPKPEPQPVEQPPPTPVHAEAQTRPVPLPPPKPAAVSHPAKPPPAPTPTPPRPHAAAIAQFPSAGTSRDGYLAYLVTLTQQHIDLLPKALVGSRRGETVLSVAVRRNGIIDRIALARSSGYPDIDDRVEQMVAAVGKFPPVPDAFEGSPVELNLNFLFPEALLAH